MKFLLNSLLALSLLTGLVASQEAPAKKDLRTWFLEDGRHFKATFESLERGKLALKSEAGKTATFPIGKLGIVDRYYLHDFKDIPLEQLEGGNIFTPEQEIKLDRSVIKDSATLKIKGGDYSFEFRSVETPHFFFLYGKGVKVKSLAETIERVWYSHAFRTPGFIDKWGDKKRVFLMMKNTDKSYDEMETYYVEALQARLDAGKITEKYFKQKKFDWNAYRGHNGLVLPNEFIEKHNLHGNADVTLVDTDRERFELYLEGYTAHQWRVQFFPGHGLLSVDQDTLRQKGNWYGVHSLILANEIRIIGRSHHGMGGRLDAKTRTFRGFGESKEWCKDYAKLSKDGKVTPSFDFYYNPPSREPEETTQDQMDRYGMGLITAGRFLEKDLKSMITRARLCDKMKKDRKFPSHEELATLYGYESTEALDAALQSFAENDNVKLKP